MADDKPQWRLRVQWVAGGEPTDYTFAGKPERKAGPDLVTYSYTQGADELDHEVQLVLQHVAAVELRQLAS